MTYGVLRMETNVPTRVMEPASARKEPKAKNVMNVKPGSGALDKILILAATVSLIQLQFRLKCLDVK